MAGNTGGRGFNVAMFLAGAALIVMGVLVVLTDFVPVFWHQVAEDLRVAYAIATPISLVAVLLIFLAVARAGTAGSDGRKLHRSLDNKMVFGICGGLADYSGFSAGSIRIFAVIVLAATLGGLGIVYLILGLTIMGE